MTEYQTSVLGGIAGGYIIPLVVTLLYFYKSKGLSLYNRIFISAHGFLFVLASLFTVLISRKTSMHAYEMEFNIFQMILLLGIVSIIYSLFKFNGSKLLHLSQIPNILSTVVIWLYGGMTLTHDWP